MISEFDYNKVIDQRDKNFNLWKTAEARIAELLCKEDELKSFILSKIKEEEIEMDDYSGGWKDVCREILEKINEKAA